MLSVLTLAAPMAVTAFLMIFRRHDRSAAASEKRQQPRSIRKGGGKSGGRGNSTGSSSAGDPSVNSSSGNFYFEEFNTGGCVKGSRCQTGSCTHAVMLMLQARSAVTRRSGGAITRIFSE